MGDSVGTRTSQEVWKSLQHHRADSIHSSREKATVMHSSTAADHCNTHTHTHTHFDRKSEHSSREVNPANTHNIASSSYAASIHPDRTAIFSSSSIVRLHAPSSQHFAISNLDNSGPDSIDPDATLDRKTKTMLHKAWGILISWYPCPLTIPVSSDEI